MKGEAIDIASQPDVLPLLPWPATLEPGRGALRVGNGGLAIEFSGWRSERLVAAAAQLNADLARCREATAAPASPAGVTPLRVGLQLRSRRYPGIREDESYRLAIDAQEIRLDAPGEWGALRGIATLTQLLGRDGSLPCVQIEDAPRLPWRGLLLDVARHFLDVDDVVRTLDGMALCKLNVLHLHLSDDQGFRFPSRRFPRLCSSECFSREDLSRIVERAADLGIRVVPELDMPGHVTSWLVAYPEWGARQVGPTDRFGVHEACLDPTSEATLDAVGALLEEVAAVFPDPCLHVGGDEVHPAWWSEDPGVRSLMQAHGLASVRDVQARFNAHVAGVVEKLGRQIVGWDEVLHPTLPDTWIVQAWRGATARDRARARGNAVVVSAPYYLDLHYPVDVHYGFDPLAPQAMLVAREDALLEDPRFAHVADGIRWTEQWRKGALEIDAAAAAGSVLGAEACLWGELVDSAVLDVRLWSRLPALAELFWSTPSAELRATLGARLDEYLTHVHPRRGVDVADRSRAQLLEIGISDDWEELTAMLEPVKWYGRLLGEEALSARLRGEEMPQARPYGIHTPLDTVADFIPPESARGRWLEACCRALGESGAAGDTARTALRDQAERWIALPTAAVPAPLQAIAPALVLLGRLVLERLDGREVHVAEVTAATRPHGELLLAVGPRLHAWLRDVP